ncbi:MAG TPA: ComEC family competence protein, partial [Flammeovirgaceae bacterium]|nr:ComEC family competence protein [Flammeovirgaceae bacterium]
MFFWSGFPFIRVVLFFAAGIVLAVYMPEWRPLMPWAGFLAGVAWIVLLVRRSQWFMRYNFFYGIIASLLWLCLGWFFLTAATESHHPQHILHVQPGDAYAARVISSPLSKGRFYQLKVEVEAVHDTTGWRTASGKVLLYLDTAAGQPHITDRLVVSGWPQPVTPPRNPYEFDYRQFLAFNNIWHRQFVRANQVRRVAAPPAFSLARLAFRMRAALQAQLQQYIKDDQALAVIQALLLGNKNDLDATTSEAYARAGAMHVLAVSGLHVGIIYLILLLLLGQRPGKVTRPVLVGAVVIPALWLYALLTGLSPSVLRAVTMFSLLALGYMFNRPANTFNLLAISAFILLVVNPYLLMSVGFQLSYLAVAGILLFYPYLENLWKPATRPLRLIWQITALSITAQLATASLSALYFHRFPVYFPVSNLLVIPAATLVV